MQQALCRRRLHSRHNALRSVPSPDPSSERSSERSSEPEPSPYESSSFEPTPGFWWTAGAAAAFILLTVLPSYWPAGFSDDPLPLAGRGALGLHFVIVVGLLAGWTWMRYFAMTYLGIGFLFWGAIAGDVLPPEPSPLQPYALGWGLLFVFHLTSFSILAFVPAVRTFFSSSAPSADA